MRGISEERLKKIAHETHDSDDTNLPVLSLLDLLISECKEPNLWIPLEEFLKSGFEGFCWIKGRNNEVLLADFMEDDFYIAESSNRHDINKITHVQPIHKPEPPQYD